MKLPEPQITCMRKGADSQQQTTADFGFSLPVPNTFGTKLLRIFQARQRRCIAGKQGNDGRLCFQHLPAGSVIGATVLTGVGKWLVPVELRQTWPGN